MTWIVWSTFRNHHLSYRWKAWWGHTPVWGPRNVYLRSRELSWWSVRCSVVSDSWDPMDCSPSGSFVHGISQATVLEWVAISSSSKSSHLLKWVDGPAFSACMHTHTHTHTHAHTPFTKSTLERTDCVFCHMEVCFRQHWKWCCYEASPILRWDANKQVGLNLPGIRST